MANKITISFKDNAKDNELFKILNAYDDKSCEIKKLLRKALKDQLTIK